MGCMITWSAWSLTNMTNYKYINCLSFTKAIGTFGKNLAKMAKNVDQPSKQFQFVYF